MMTADQIHDDEQPDDGGPEFDEAEVLHFDAPEVDLEQRAPVPFRIGDDDRILVSYRPKYGVLMGLIRLSESNDELASIRLVDQFVDAALDPESADYLRGKFEDPDSDWDYDVLVPVIKALTGRWFPKSRGGSSQGGRATSSRSGRRSTVRRRSGGSI